MAGNAPPSRGGCLDTNEDFHSTSHFPVYVGYSPPRISDTGVRIPRRSTFQTPAKYFLGVASEIASPLLRTGARLISDRPASEPASWRRGLILGHSHIGDVLYRTCSLGALKDGLPLCEWDYLTSSDSAQILFGNPAVREILPYQSGDESWHITGSAMSDIRARDYDVILCTNIVRPYADFLTAARLRIPNRVGFINKGLSGLLTHPVNAEIPSPYPAYFRMMVSAIAGIPAGWALRPRIFPTAGDADSARAAWTDLKMRSEVPVVACTLTTRQPRGQWPSELFERALELVHERTKAQIVFCGSSDDAARLEAARVSCRAPSTVIAGRLSITSFAAFLERCSVLLAMDSGPRHIANAVGTPVVFARNLTYSRVEAGPYCDTEKDVAPADEFVTSRSLPAMFSKLTPSVIADAVLESLSPTSKRI